MPYIVRNDSNGFPRLYLVTLWGTKCVSPPCLTHTAALNHRPESRK